MRRFSSPVVLGAIILLAIAAFVFLVRGFFFDVDDVVLSVSAPEEIDVGGEDLIRVTLTNSARGALRSGAITLDLSSGLILLEARDAQFENLASLEQVTAQFRVHAEGRAGDAVAVRATAAFRPGMLSASLKKEAEATVHLRELPVSVVLSFPADASGGREFTFFIRFSSQAEATIEPVGLTLSAPEAFRVVRTQPATVPGAGLLWDFGAVRGGQREEIAVTGLFPEDVSGGEFTARVGVLDASRRALASYREAREYLNVRAGAVPIDLLFAGLENPREAVVAPGETIELTLRYRNAMSVTAEGVSVSLALTHDAIDQRSAASSERFARSVSGEYVWDPDNVLDLRAVPPDGSGTIAFTAKLDLRLPLRNLSDANQTIPVRARTISGGRILGERNLLLKIRGQLAINAEVVYHNAPGGFNKGPLPPRVGETTTYTATLSATGGTNGLNNVIARTVLGSSVAYVALIEPLNERVAYDPVSREVRWDIGELPVGAGSFSSPRSISFRIALTPTQEEVGRVADLLTAVSATGEDAFVERTLDASDTPVSTDLPDDFTVSRVQGIVQAATP